MLAASPLLSGDGSHYTPIMYRKRAPVRRRPSLTLSPFLPLSSYTIQALCSPPASPLLSPVGPSLYIPSLYYLYYYVEADRASI